MKSSHRPWPPPQKPWLMTQTWRRLLFAHWPVDPDVLRPYIPVPLTLDTYDERAWLSIVVFDVTDARPRFVPSVPALSHFPQLNVRTYVLYNDKPGAYFFSLDADHLLAVIGARSLYYLPYYAADISISPTRGGVDYNCRRNYSSKAFQVRYRPISDIYQAESGTLTYWLAERYCLYTRHGHYLYRGEILHEPWLLQNAEADIIKNTMIESVPSCQPSHLQYADQQTSVMWGLSKVAHIF